MRCSGSRGSAAARYLMRPPDAVGTGVDLAGFDASWGLAAIRSVEPRTIERQSLESGQRG
jgi:hypothetical protein